MPEYKSDIPEGVYGEWRVERFTVTPKDEALERMRIWSNRGRYVPAGTYTRLMRDRTCVMSDTPDEIHDLWEPIHRAHGKILINGLGLGIVTELCLEKPEVEHVTVVELNPNVIKLVGLHLFKKHGNRLTIHRGDAFTFKADKGSRFGMVWHDIWDDLCGDNLEGMKTLHRRYGRMAEWQGSWGRGFIERWAR